MLHGEAVSPYSEKPNMFRFCVILATYLFLIPAWIEKTDVPKNFAKFTGKRRCWSLFSIKLQAFMPGVFL